MLLRILMAMVALIFSWFGLSVGFNQRAGPIPTRSVLMSRSKNLTTAPEPDGGGVKTRALNIKLKDLPDPAKAPEDGYSHRSKEKFSPQALHDVIESLRAEKQLEPIQVVKTAKGWIVIAGHRRLAAFHYLANLGKTPGFSPNTEVHALELIGASKEDLLVRSVADNENRLGFDHKERLLAGRTLHDANVGATRGAAALGVSEKTFERLIKVVKCPRIFEHVVADHLPPTAAAALVAAAEKNGRLEQMCAHVDKWVEQAKEDLEEKDRLARNKSGKGLKPNQLRVARQLNADLVNAWVYALIKGERLTNKPAPGFDISFNDKTESATVKFKVNCGKDAVPHLIRVAAQASLICKLVMKVAKERHEKESQDTSPATASDQDFLDRELIKSAGLEDVVAELDESWDQEHDKADQNEEASETERDENEAD